MYSTFKLKYSMNVTISIRQSPLNKGSKTHHLNRLITLSPLTEMARKFHLSNGAVQIQVNETTQNFEYEKV